MGSGQSRELCDRVAPERVFVNTNAQEMQRLMQAMHDVAVLAQRGREAASQPDTSSSAAENEDEAAREEEGEGGAAAAGGSTRGSVNMAHEVNSEDAPRPFTEEEQRELFAPYDTLCFANHYLTNEVFQREEAAGLIVPTTTTTTAASHTEKRKKEKDKTNKVAAVSMSPLHVLDILVRNPFLTALDLSYNHLQDIALVPLIEHALTPLRQLIHLNLAGNALGPEGCHALATYLAADPLLETLVLLQCGLDDATVEPVVTRGLPTNRHLRLLNLDFNACTERTVERLLITLDTNETLAVVFLEGVPHCPETLQVLPPDCHRRVEYACTSQGYFRSGRSYYDALDRSNHQEEQQQQQEQQGREGEDDEGVIVVDDDDDVSAAAQAERFRQRCRVLTRELSGQRPLDPRLMRRLRAKLEPRLAHYQATLRRPRAEAQLRQAMAVTIGAAQKDNDEGEDESEESRSTTSSRASSRASGTAYTTSNSPLAADRQTAELTDDKAEAQEAEAKDVQEANNDNNNNEEEEEESVQAEQEQEVAMQQSWVSQLPAVLAELFPHSSRLRSRRDRQRALQQAQRYGTTLPHGTHFTTSLTRSRGTRQQSRTAKSRETEELYRRRGEACLTRPRVLPNGFDRVVLPPRALQGDAHGPNYILQGPPSRLRPCWCTPTEISAAYAGTLHYHCRREEHIDYTQSLWRPSPLRGGTARTSPASVTMMSHAGGAQEGKRGQRAMPPRWQAGSTHPGSGSLPPINNHNNNNGAYTGTGRNTNATGTVTKGKYFTNHTAAGTRWPAADQSEGGRADGRVSGVASPGHPTVRDYNASSTPSLNSNGLLPALYGTRTNSPSAAGHHNNNNNNNNGTRAGLMSVVSRTNSAKGRSGNVNSPSTAMMMMMSSVPSPLPRRTRPAYHGCRGTGHRCVSMSSEAVAAAQSMATGAAASATTKHGSTLFVSREGVAMELHYNPVAYFTAPYQTCAAIHEGN